MFAPRSMSSKSRPASLLLSSCAVDDRPAMTSAGQKKVRSQMVIDYQIHSSYDQVPVGIYAEIITISTWKSKTAGLLCLRKQQGQ
ncbi:hypothetical protein EJ03DRAFT_100745 [Teratosphaeria nubilosa]|uniref:Uncharacterized protein n=1 Tax=Teratosphaeria nubilosa TaxID=161662 RepID=A0A6G1LLR3_9PEZI|nr:hypothetical protein EJ03DRAFT_100745 [Teratosphaeria nubilosa]